MQHCGARTSTLNPTYFKTVMLWLPKSRKQRWSTYSCLLDSKGSKAHARGRSCQKQCAFLWQPKTAAQTAMARMRTAWGRSRHEQHGAHHQQSRSRLHLPSFAG